jgi:ribosomal protein S18 acetylase RimI-like enzyme
MRIRRSHEHDDEIQELDRDLFPVEYAPPLQIPASADTWVAIDGDHVVGYLVAHGAYLDRYGVHPTLAGRGIGRRLLRAWLRSLGGGEAWTYTSADNAQSINALIRAGFRAWRPALLPAPWSRAPEYGWCIWLREAR